MTKESREPLDPEAAAAIEQVFGGGTYRPVPEAPVKQGWRAAAGRLLGRAAAREGDWRQKIEARQSIQAALLELAQGSGTTFAYGRLLPGVARAEWRLARADWRQSGPAIGSQQDLEAALPGRHIAVTTVSNMVRTGARMLHIEEAEFAASGRGLNLVVEPDLKLVRDIQMSRLPHTSVDRPSSATQPAPAQPQPRASDDTEPTIAEGFMVMDTLVPIPHTRGYNTEYELIVITRPA